MICIQRITYLAKGLFLFCPTGTTWIPIASIDSMNEFPFFKRSFIFFGVSGGNNNGEPTIKSPMNGPNFFPTMPRFKGGSALLIQLLYK